MLSAKLNYETHNVELLAIVQSFKTWRLYFEKKAYTILVFMDYNNLKKFIITIDFSNYQI